MIYIDTSVLVAYYSPEAFSDKVEEIIVNAETSFISQLTEVELVSAISRKIRERTLSHEGGNKIVTIFQSHIDQKSLINLPVLNNYYSTARDWISRFSTPLRTLDALHLAIAHSNSLPFVTADTRLANASKFFGIETTLIQ